LAFAGNEGIRARISREGKENPNDKGTKEIPIPDIKNKRF
jgi:hypothetical protein